MNKRDEVLEVIDRQTDAVVRMVKAISTYADSQLEHLNEEDVERIHTVVTSELKVLRSTLQRKIFNLKVKA